MHIFLYQAARHQKNQWGGRRLVQHTIRMDFDLELLKQGIKGRYEIVGCGLHPFQKAMAEMDMMDDFYGHIIQIEESKNAVWFKLNYDNIGRFVTKYQGGWRDLNPDDIKDHIAEYKELTKQLSIINSAAATVRSQVSYTSHVASPRNPLGPLLEPVKEAELVYHETLNETAREVSRLQDIVNRNIKECQAKVTAYLKEHKG